jgi:hypothetical protein
MISLSFAARGHAHAVICLVQVERLVRAGTPFTGKSYVNEFGIGAVEMTLQPESVLSPWYSTDESSSGVDALCGCHGVTAWDCTISCMHVEGLRMCLHRGEVCGRPERGPCSSGGDRHGVWRSQR